MKSSGIFLLAKTSEECFEIENLLSFILFGALNMFEHLFNMWKHVHFHSVFHVLFIHHCIKSVRIRSYSGPYFPAFGLTTERYEVSLHIQFECWKMWTRITPNTDTFYAVHKGLQTIRPQRFAQSVHKQSAHKGLLNQANLSMFFSLYRLSLEYFCQ